MYNNTVTGDLQVKESSFRYFFAKKYNTGFDAPKTDLCSTCLQFKDKLKKASDIHTKNQLVIQQRLHKMRSNAFYDLLKKKQADPTAVTFSFDCQKNLALPKKVQRGKSTVRSYVWTELDHQKGSNEIAFAIHHILATYEFNGHTKIIYLFCDSCGAQNHCYRRMQ
ncbi:hypothetical protein ILUMI_26898 [Ignelater luminosus]|uniref:Uncharacterized protein n=1 Tax=Ignelater luminosus TaxID=2038154 RepID=A0A8K0C903_IGNLU|nr:hypothetical protein ILUMI_26898 [Ignelater luminosus]